MAKIIAMYGPTVIEATVWALLDYYDDDIRAAAKKLAHRFGISKKQARKLINRFA